MRRRRPRPNPPPPEQVPGQLPLFGEENETAPATTAGPAPADDTTTDTDETPRTEP